MQPFEEGIEVVVGRGQVAGLRRRGIVLLAVLDRVQVLRRAPPLRAPSATGLGLRAESWRVSRSTCPTCALSSCKPIPSEWLKASRKGTGWSSQIERRRAWCGP